jgi:hypothetical protein
MEVSGKAGVAQVPVTVALCLAPLASVLAASSDDLCCFGFDEGLEHELHPLADDIDVTACSDGLEQVGKVGTGQSHWVPPLTSC